MNTHSNKTQENQNHSVSAAQSLQQTSAEPTFQFVDNRLETVALQELQENANKSPQAIQLKTFQNMINVRSNQQQSIQKKDNNTGLPDKLKTGIENLSGYAMDDVKVHYNSDKPAQLQAHGYAQGSDIHLAGGQEKHLPHEAWHVVQQKQGRVQPTMQMKGNINVNYDAGLEKEADIMGAKALQMIDSNAAIKSSATVTSAPAQLLSKTTSQQTINSETNVIQLLPNPEEVPFITIEELEIELDAASMTEIYHFLLALRKMHSSDEEKPEHLKFTNSYMKREYRRIIGTLDQFQGNVGYVASSKPFIHDLFGDLTLTLYPVEGDSPDKGDKPARQKVHRPVLDIEIVGREPYARCYIGLYGVAGDSGFKDVTSDEDGNVTLNDIGLMNLGNPFKALLWAEDYLKSQEHYKNSDNSKPAPKPVVRSFLVPLADAQGMIMRYGKYEDVRPLDQDRGAGQFGHISKEHLYSEILTPVLGSLVSFFHDPDDYDAASESNQKKFGLADLQEFLTGHREDVRQIATNGMAAQHDRFGHDAEFDPKYEEIMDAYYKSVDNSETGFTGGTVGTAPEQRSSRLEDVLSRFPLVSSLMAQMGGKIEDISSSDSAKTPVASLKSRQSQGSLDRLREFIQAYAGLEIAAVDEVDDEVENQVGDEVDSALTDSTSVANDKDVSGAEPSTSKPKSKKSEVSNSDLQHSRVAGNEGPAILRNWFTVINNPGGGDCLFHALEGETLDGPQMLALRAEVANVTAHEEDTPERMGYNAEIVGNTIAATPSLTRFAPLIVGRQTVPNQVLAMMQSVPGIYAGPEEIIQWIKLKNQPVIVFDEDGTVTRYTSGGGTQLFNLRVARTAGIMTILQGIAANAQIVLYKSPGHWERVNGASGHFPNA